MNVILALLMLVSATSALAAPAAPAAAEPSRVGLGQDSAKEPAMLKNLRLSDPLVRQKYLNEPDMLRFLRATYSEGCVRGIISQTITAVKLDRENKYSPEMQEAAQKLYDSRRVWKMSSYEMEVMFKQGYLKTALYCDCMMKEVTDSDLVNPRKGMEVIEKLPASTQKSCEVQAVEKIQQQLEKSKE